MAVLFNLLRSALVLGLGLVISVFVKGYRQRTHFRHAVRQYGGPALPGHSWVFGHLITVGKVMADHPSDIHGQNVFHFIAARYPELHEAGAFYVDLWPISFPMLVTYDPDLIAQFTQETPRPKHEILEIEFNGFTGMKDLVCSEGPAWKKWRAAFNPGFSSQNVMSLVPAFVEEATVWKEYLVRVARSGEKIRLEDNLMKATCDVIGRSVLGVSLGIQKGDSRLWTVFKNAIGFLYADWSPPSLSKALHPLRHFYMWHYNRILRQELEPLLRAQMQQETTSKGPKTVSGLAVQAHRKDNLGHEGSHRESDAEFLDVAVEQMKIFLLAGHDTTSSTLCFVYDHLARHPDVLERVRLEHESVFGSDPAATAQLISEDPTLLNRLSFTLAVIKETLRLVPAVGSVRSGSPTFFLTNTTSGRRMPTDGFILFVSSIALHRNPHVWDRPDDFAPDRWQGGELTKVRKNAWRPFELGPRACIGQELAMTELKMFLAMTIRDLDIVPAYDADDPKVLGSQAYQAQLPRELIAHPSKGMPVTVRLRMA